MNLNSGVIIGVVGAPRCGKTFLSERLAKHCDGICIPEWDEDDIPPRIIEDLSQDIRPLERVMWFRNLRAKQYLEALRHKAEGKLVVLDTFWLSYRFYLESLVDKFERKIGDDLLAIDEKVLGWPDVVIFLKSSEKEIRTFLKMSGRSYDQNNDFINNCILPVNERHATFFNTCPRKNIITIDRSKEVFDFEELESLHSIAARIEQSLVQNIAAGFEYNYRLQREKEKAQQKYGDACTDSLGNLEHDAQDYAINELVGMDRYAEIIIARARLYNKNDGVELGEAIRIKIRELAMQLIAYRMSLLQGGTALGKSEYE